MTTRKKVVLGHPIHPRVREILEAEHAVVLAEDDAARARELADAHAFCTLLSTRVDDALLDGAPALEVVGNYAVGVDNVDTGACRARGVRVVNTPDVLTAATAECAVALLFAAARRVGEGERMCRAGRFDGWAPDMLLGLEVRGRRAVLVGEGRIGRATGALFSTLGLEVEYITRQTAPDDIDAALGRAQVLSLHAPLTDATRHWLDARRLALLPADAIVINTARGPLVDEAALVDALEERRIFAAGLDVYEREPAIPERLRALQNVVLLPHLGSATRAARRGMAEKCAEGVRAVLAGERPDNLVV